jgi:streptogramin lyase
MVNGGANTLSKIHGPTGATLSPATGFTGGGLSVPFAIAIDPSNNAWVVNPATYVNFTQTAPTSVSKFSSAGTPALGSPFSGGGLAIAPNFNTLSPRDIAFDALGNAWIANNTASVTELNGLTGVALSPSAGFPLGSANPNPNGVAVDSAGHVWISGFNGNVLSEVSVATGTVLFTSTYGANGMEQPYSVAIDASNNVWLPNQYDPNSLVGFTISKFNATGGAVGVYSGGGILGPDGVAVDGGGNIWVSNEIHNSITEMGNNGVAISPSTGYLSAGLFLAADIAVDPSGNVWVPNAAQPVTYANGTTVVEFVGAAVPVVTPIATAVATNKLGARP